MSGSVSQVPFWRDSTPLPSSTKKEGLGGPNAVYLSYTVFLGLSILGGFFGLDHLYLRSPLTAIAKFFVNLSGFGVWWLYDAAQALFNKDVVKLFGLGVPGLGPQGIAAGVLGHEIPDQKHLRFFTYAISLFLGGAFGLDSFVTGRSQVGAIRLISLVSIIGAPFAIGYWIYKIFLFLTDTKGVVSADSEYFGAPTRSLQDSFLSFFPGMGFLFHPFDSIMEMVRNAIGDAIKPVTKTVDDTVQLGKNTVQLGKNTVQLGRNALEKSAELAGKVTNTVRNVAKAAQSAAQATPIVSLYEMDPTALVDPTALGTPSAPEMKNAEETPTIGGMHHIPLVGALVADHLNPVHYVLLVTIVAIILGGTVLTYYRSKHVREEHDDSPPEPGVFRVPDSKGSAA